MLKAKWTIISIMLQLPIAVWSHARLMRPPSRSSMWRLNYPTPINYDDLELMCGGLGRQWKTNNGKCGVCGDPYDMPSPRENETGGKYAKGVITGNYKSGEVIDVTVEITANHKGYFEFKICPNNDITKVAEQECFDEYPLEIAEGGGAKYDVSDKGTGNVDLKLKLPDGLLCTQCVLQWTYTGGHHWGKCEDGQSRLGCGPQDTYRACADIAIA